MNAKPDSDSRHREIGGYFGLELPAGERAPHPQAFRLQSGRAAFAALLGSGRPAAVWMPRYICDSMLSPLRAAAITVRFYGIDEELAINPDVNLAEGDWLVYVNYFGVCAEVERRLWQRFDAKQVVLDRSQAFFAAPLPCLANIYSPRKFFGVPDGGLLVTSLDVEAPRERDHGSLGRCEHLLLRHSGRAQDGYAAFRKAEESLADVTPRRMSRLTSRLFASIDFERARLRRNENFRYLHGMLGHRNGISIDPEKIDGPLCYPLLLQVAGVRERLAKRNIFIPQYWAEVLGRCSPGDFETQLVERCLPVPCDQRYDVEDLEAIVQALDDP